MMIDCSWLRNVAPPLWFSDAEDIQRRCNCTLTSIEVTD